MMKHNKCTAVCITRCAFIFCWDTNIVLTVKIPCRQPALKAGTLPARRINELKHILHMRWEACFNYLWNLLCLLHFTSAFNYALWSFDLAEQSALRLFVCVWETFFFFSLMNVIIICKFSVSSYCGFKCLPVYEQRKTGLQTVVLSLSASRFPSVWSWALWLLWCLHPWTWPKPVPSK